MTTISTLLVWSQPCSPSGSATPALAGHVHHMDNGSGCRDIPVDVPGRDHEGYDDEGHIGNGRKYHGAAYMGAAVEHDPDTGVVTLGQGNSPNTVAGGPCA